MSRLTNFSPLLLLLANCALVKGTGIQECVDLGVDSGYAINIGQGDLSIITPGKGIQDSALTLEACKSHCSGYKYYAVVGHVCNCADSATGWTACEGCTTDSCPGDATEVCGDSSSDCVYALKDECTENHCLECTETLLTYDCITCIPGYSIKDVPNVCTEDLPIDPVDPPTDPLKRCKKSYRYFLRHLKKCRSVKGRYPKWVLMHSGHRND